MDEEEREQEEAERKKTSVDMPMETYRVFKAEATTRGLKFGEALVEAMNYWIAKDAADDRTERPGAPPYSAAERIWIRKLLKILHSGCLTPVTGIEIALEVYEASLRNYRDERSQETTGTTNGGNGPGGNDDSQEGIHQLPKRPKAIR